MGSHIVGDNAFFFIVRKEYLCWVGALSFLRDLDIHGEKVFAVLLDVLQLCAQC